MPITLENTLKNKLNHSLDKTKSALLVIDVQENLLNPHSRIHMDPENIMNFILSLNETITAFKHHNLPVIYTVNEWTNPLVNFFTGNVCKKGAPGTGIDSNVRLINNNIFYKDSNSAFSNKDLVNFLTKDAITELYVTGLMADYCVTSTVIDALSNHYNVIIVKNAVGAKNEKTKLKSINRLEKKGACIITAGYPQVKIEKIDAAKTKRALL